MKSLISTFEPAGFNHCPPQTGSMFLDGKCHKISFVRELDNQYDKYAIRIDCRSQKIGYVPRFYVPVPYSNKTCPGNYNQFFAECLDAGVPFNGFAIRRMSMKLPNGGMTRFDARHIIDSVPEVFVSMSIEHLQDDPVIEHKELMDLSIRTSLRFVCNCTYVTPNYKSQNGCIWYNKFHDKFFVWCGEYASNIDFPAVQVLESSLVEFKEIGMESINSYRINIEELSRLNRYSMGERQSLFDMFVKRAS